VRNLAIPEAQRALERLAETIAALERKRQSRIFCLIHGGAGHICEPSTLWPIIRTRKQFRKGQLLEILIHSGGGEADAAYRLIRFLRRRYAHVNALVPIAAKSAATLICLGTDRIFMGEFAHLGPVDIQIEDPLHRGMESFSPLDEFKSLEFLRDYAVELLDFFVGLFLQRSGMSVKEAMHETIPCITGILQPLYAQMDPLEMGEHRRSLAIAEEYATRLLNLVRNPNQERIVERLVWKYPSHTFCIDYDEAKEMRLPVARMEARDENALLDLLTDFRRYDLSFCGFAPPLRTPRKQAVRQVPAKAVPTRPKPASTAAAVA
jgi:hypothetical protein